MRLVRVQAQGRELHLDGDAPNSIIIEKGSAKGLSLQTETGMRLAMAW